MNQIFRLITIFPKSILAFSIILCLFFGYFTTKLEIDASTQTLLLDNDKDLNIYRDITKKFHTENFLVIAYTPKEDLLSKHSLDKIAKISYELSKLSGVKSVFSILKAPLLQNKNLPISDLLEHIPSLKDKDIDLKAAKKEFLTSPIYKNNLVSDDFKTTAILVNLKTDEKYNEFIERRSLLKEKDLNKTITKSQKIELNKLDKKFKVYRDEIRLKDHENIQSIKAVLEQNKGDEKLFLGGISMIADDMVGFVKNDLYTYGISVLLLLVFCLWLFFRQIKFIVLPVLVCVLSVILASGLFGLFGYEITVISSNYIALQLIITISIVIHLITGYRELYRIHPRYSQSQLVYLTLKTRANPCFFAIFTTVIGFISLSLSDIKPIIMLGIMMSIGVSISLIVAFVVFGSSLMLFKKIPPKRNFEDGFKMTLWCANVSIKFRKTIYFISLLVVIVGLYGINKLRVENSFIGYFKQNTEIYKGMKVIDTKLGGTIPLDVVIKFRNKKDALPKSQSNDLDGFENEFNEQADDPQYWFSPNKINVIKKVSKFLQNKQFVGNVSSIDMLLEVAKNLNGGKNLDSFSLALLYNGLPEEFKNLLLTPYINIKDNEAHFVIRTIDSDDKLRRDEFIKDLKASLALLLKDDNVSITVGGIMVLYNNMLQNLLASQVDTFGFVVLALFLVFVYIFRSLKLSVIGIVANLVPLCAVFGTMGILGIRLDIMSITIAAISLGIGVDNIIHYIHRYRREIIYKSQTQAIISSHASIGYAMYYTSFTIFLGFSVMVLSNFWPTIYFGLLTDLVMVAMLAGALLLLPALIITFYQSKICKKE